MPFLQVVIIPQVTKRPWLLKSCCFFLELIIQPLILIVSNSPLQEGNIKLNLQVSMTEILNCSVEEGLKCSKIHSQALVVNSQNSRLGLEGIKDQNTHSKEKKLQAVYKQVCVPLLPQAADQIMVWVS